MPNRLLFALTRVALTMPALALVGSTTGCGVFGLTTEERAALSQHQAAAKTYYDGNRLSQALDQVRQGLEIESTDYQLNTLRGYCLMRQAGDPRYAPTPARRRALLDESQAAFDATLALRPMNQHGPQALLGDALLHEAQARLALEERDQARLELQNGELAPPERALRQIRAQEFDLKGNEHLAAAERDLEHLLRRGEILLHAHKHMLNVKSLRGDYAGAVEHGRKFLERSQKSQERTQERYDSTVNVGGEQAIQHSLGQLVDDELLVRSQLANLHFNHKDYELAVTELDRVLVLDPTRSPDYLNRAHALAELDRVEEAYRDTQKFLATQTLAAGHPQVRKAYDLLVELEKKRR